uniref:F-box associated domain-containing protein n=1 Tax=Oryza rufipogon TaxID=4529 RepID=A0A0E0NVN0_ORYRU
MQASQSVSLHGNLHWMVQRGSGSTARLNVLVFDTARERFRLMEAPPWDDSRETPPAAGRPFHWRGGAVAVSPATNTMEMWVLDDDDSSGGARAWRLAERVGLVMMWDKRDLSRAFSSATQVSAVQGDAEGEEVILHNDGQHRRPPAQGVVDGVRLPLRHAAEQRRAARRELRRGVAAVGPKPEDVGPTGRKPCYTSKASSKGEGLSHF